MRRSFRALHRHGLIAAARLLVASMGILVASSIGPSAAVGACSVAGRSFELVGTAEDVSGHVVTYRIHSIIEVDEGVPQRPDRPVVGDLIEVEYSDGDERFIDESARYRVGIWDRDSLGYISGVHTAEDVCGGGGTTYADGSGIDTGRFTRNGFELWVAPAVLIPIAVMILVIRSIIDRRHQRKVAERFAAQLASQRASTADPP